MKRFLVIILATSYLGASSGPGGVEPRIASPVITFFVSSIIVAPTDDPSKKLKDFSDVETLSKTLMKSELEPDIHDRPVGLYVSYKGFLDFTDENGQIFLPRKHAEDKITLIVTKQLYPIILEGQTVEFFVRKKDAEAAYYKLKRSKDEKTGVFLWTVKKIPTPTSTKIPPEALVIYAKPHDLFIPEGTVTTTGGPNLVLPTIYPTKYLNKDLNALSFLKYNRQFFTPVSQETAYRYAADRYTKNLRPL
ncbi:TPA: hypothetical protein DDZ86_04915 [Candidatus Dependentiae bacterium]|nr:MAG: hypothetical protein A2Y17_09720 [Clostridiales bacterium GWF2_38_85]HBL98952.1 hypothetical protein [Candidatus Dependentiae bacterium]